MSMKLPPLPKPRREDQIIKPGTGNPWAVILLTLLVAALAVLGAYLVVGYR